MKNLIKPYSFALYLLSFLLFLVIGTAVSGWAGAGDGQGLAGGAIVLFNGIITGLVALVAALFVARFAPRKFIIWTNVVMLAILLVLFLILRMRYIADHKDEVPYEAPDLKPKTSAPVAEPVSYQPSAVLNDANEMGMGFFSPNFFEYPTLYFYGQPNFEKGVMEHFAYDSLVFKNTEIGWQAVSGPPWLVPEYAKLDYGIYQFKLLSIGRDLLEIEVNRTNGRIAYVDRAQGNFALWPEFILSVNSVEFLEEHPQPVRIKPLEHASEMHAEFTFMQPLQVKDNWLQVALRTGELKTIDIGWIKWQENGKLLVRYSLLF